MSVIGFDVGNDTSVVALARRKGIDVILNKESKRETPAMVSFTSKQRFLGTDGAGIQNMNLKNTVYQLKRLIGRKFSEPSVQSDLKIFPFTVEQGENDSIIVKVMYMDELVSFTPERLVAMLLTDLKQIAQGELGSEVKDCVIACPIYFTDSQRKAMLDAASIAGLNCLRLMHETTATALAYGIYKTDLPENEPVNVVFVDLGHSSMQVVLVAFMKGQLKIISQAWDDNLGGRNFDQVLVDYFADEFKAAHKADVKSNARASMRLYAACDKLKKILSANPEAPLNVECLIDDKDFRSSMTREKFEELSKHVLDLVAAPCKKVLEDSGLQPEQISSVEVVGSGSRVPAIMSTLKAVFGREPSRTMNASEAVARGCALQCAMLSPTFKVREFEVQDVYPYGLNFVWQDEQGNEVKTLVFPPNNTIPSTKMLSFHRKEPFSIQCRYADMSCVPAGTSETVATFQVGPFSVPEGQEKAKLKVKVRLTLHGTVSCEGAHVVVEEEVEAPAEEKKDDSTKDAPMEDAEAKDAGDAEAPKDDAPKAEKKKKVSKTEVPVQSFTYGLPAALISKFHEKEFEMQLQDRVMEDTKEKRNALEEYVYSMRNKLGDQLEGYVSEANKENLLSKLNVMEDWLYGEGEEETKGVYVAKLAELKALTDPIQERYDEDQARPEAASQLSRECSKWREMATSGNVLYDHISSEEKAQVVKECDEAMAWLKEKLALQKEAAKKDPVVLYSQDILKKRDIVARICQSIMSKPRPAPKPVEEPKPMETDAEAKTDAEPAPMETEGEAKQ